MSWRKRQKKHKKQKNVDVVNNDTTKVISNNTTTVTRSFLCHKGFKEVFPRIYVGKSFDVDRSLLSCVDVLVPLNSVNGDIWDANWRGEILYIPISDFGVLPSDVEKWAVNRIIAKYNKGKSIAIFCAGGHGRTGYMASLVLGKLGVDDPINLLRTTYCDSAVETNKQVKAIANYLDKPEFIQKYEVMDFHYLGFYDRYSYEPKYNDRYVPRNTGNRCESCIYFNTFADSYYGYCDLLQKSKHAYDEGCINYSADI